MTPSALSAALGYLPGWIEHQRRLAQLPGGTLAVVHQGKLVLELAVGHADLASGEVLTPQHRFRVASHSKTFTATGVMRLREQGRLRLDDPIGQHVGGLHPQVAAVTLAQLLSHSAGLVRDGADAGQWQDRRPFLNEAELRADLAAGPMIEPNTRFKYSNHGFGLLGLAIEAITGEPYNAWITREVVAAAGLAHTRPDTPLHAGEPFARGHTPLLPLGQRGVVPGDNATRALSAATGFVSTASDLARFFAQLSPTSKKSVLSVDSRREMSRPRWREPHASAERWYGLGTMSGRLPGHAADWDWFGHTGGFQGTVSRTVVVLAQQLAVSVLTNATDGLCHVWVDGCLHLLRAAALRGAPTRPCAAWTGRWWGMQGPVDLLPLGDRVLVANPALANPLMDASEIEPDARQARDGTLRGRITLAGGFAHHGEPARIERDAAGRAQVLWLAGMRLLPEAQAMRELARRYPAVAPVDAVKKGRAIKVRP